MSLVFKNMMLNKYMLLNYLARPQSMELFPYYTFRLFLISKYSI